MRTEGLRDLTRDELHQKREELRQEIFNLKLRKNFSELDNPLKLRTLRRDIARIETILHEDAKGIRPLVDQAAGILDSGTDKTKNEDA